MDDYKPNSHKYREAEREKKQFEKVVKGKVKSGDDNAKRIRNDLFSYVVYKVLIPGVKDIIGRTVKNGIDIILYKDAGDRRRNNDGVYTSYSRRDSNVISMNDYQYSRVAGPVYKRIILETRDDAEEVLSTLSDIVDQYGVVSLADLYEIVGIKGEYTDQKYGWTDVSKVQAVPVSDGYLLKLPKCILLT